MDYRPFHCSLLPITNFIRVSSTLGRVKTLKIRKVHILFLDTIFLAREQVLYRDLLGLRIEKCHSGACKFSAVKYFEYLSKVEFLA